MSGGDIIGNRLNIGWQGTGTFTQTSGLHTITDKINLGQSTGSSGTYNLSGGVLDVSDRIYIGVNSGTARFEHFGGSIVASEMELGPKGTLAIGYDFNIRDLATGALFPNVDTITGLGSVTFGVTNGATATHNISTTISKLEIGSSSGGGAFNLNEGTFTVGTIQLDDNSTYTQTGGILDVGTFNQDGGTVNSPFQNLSIFNQFGGTINGPFQNQATFNQYEGALNGTFENQGSVNFSGNFTGSDGMRNEAYVTIGSGGIATLNGSGLENNGIMSIYGMLSGDGPVTNYGSMSIDDGTIAGSGGFTNYALLTQSSGHFTLSNTGINRNYGNMDLQSGYQFRLNGADLTNNGTVNLNGAIVAGTGSLDNSSGGVIAGRGTIATDFSNSGGILLLADGTTNIIQAFTNSGTIQLTSFTASLSGGAINNSGTIQGFGQVGNNVGNSGTIEAFGGILTLSGETTNNSGGLMRISTGNKLLVANGLATNAGVINLTGGTFDNNNHAMTSTGQISGYGTFATGGLINNNSMTLTGGTTTVNGDVVNNGNIGVAHNPAIFTGDVTNNGTVKTTDTTVTFAGAFTNNGAYISDPSKNYFTNLIIGESGYLVGGEGDYWYIQGNFETHSDMNNDWNTAGANLGFTTGTDNSHDFYLTASDLGAIIGGYTYNFAWGRLSLEGNILNLFDGNGNDGGALYLGEIFGAEISGSFISNIFSSKGLNIYYLSSLPGNEYLGGLTFDLQGGGQLRGVGGPVPIPTTVLLLGSGLIGLAGFRREFNRRNKAINELRTTPRVANEGLWFMA